MLYHWEWRRVLLSRSGSVKDAVTARQLLCKADTKEAWEGGGVIHSKVIVSRSRWLCGLRRRSAAAQLLETWVRIPPRGTDIRLLWILCVVRALCDGPIPRPEESYRMCVSVSMSVIRFNNNPLHIGNLGSNRAEGHWYLSLVNVMCCQRSLWADPSSRGVQPNVRECLNKCDQAQQ
jgi:hypothetical protein